MARRQDPSDTTLQKPLPWVSEEAVADDFRCEREFVFSKTTYSLAGVETVDSRFDAFLQSESNRASAAQGRLASQNMAELQSIIDKECRREEEADCNPNSFVAQKRKFERLVSDIEPYVVDPLVQASRDLQREFSEQCNRYVPLLKPMNVPDAAWRRAIWRVNAKARKQGKARDFAIGNGKAPQHQQFGSRDRSESKPKTRGRWRRTKDALETPIRVQTRSGKEVKVSRRELRLINTYRNAINGLASARREFMTLIKELDRRDLLKPNPSMRSRKDALYAKLFNIVGDRPFARAIERLRLMYERRYGSTIRDHGENSLASTIPDQDSDVSQVLSSGFCRAAPANPPVPVVPTRRRQRVDPSNFGKERGPATGGARTRKQPS